MSIGMCPKCSLARQGKFCWRCGSELLVIEDIKCPKCASKLSENDKFCTECGVPVQNVVKLSIKQQKKVLKTQGGAGEVNTDVVDL